MGRNNIKSILSAKVLIGSNRFAVGCFTFFGEKAGWKLS